jgi:hypothetical protein
LRTTMYRLTGAGARAAAVGADTALIRISASSEIESRDTGLP